MIKVNNLSKYYGDYPAVINISFELNQLRDSLLHLQSGQDIKTMSTTMSRDEKSLNKINNIK